MPNEPRFYDKTYYLNWTTGRVENVGSADGLEAIKQFVKKSLMTPRFKCYVYDNQYGSEVTELITAKNATREFVLSDLPRLVRDCVLADSRIDDITDFDYLFEGDRLQVSFYVKTKLGDFSVLEEF